MIYMTGDTHRDFERLFWFCKSHQTTREDDVMIILGDVGLNYYGGWRDYHAKQQLASLPLTFFCIHGNHEERPQNIPGYEVKECMVPASCTSPAFLISCSPSTVMCIS